MECIQWSDILWLHTFGLGPHNIMEYFYNSPFFDSLSNNQNIRTQALGIDFLKSMVGIQYIFDESNSNPPSLFVIKKIKRTNPHSVFLLSAYYCIDGIIYESPNLTELFRSRTAKASNYLFRAFDDIRDAILLDRVVEHTGDDMVGESATVASTDPNQQSHASEYAKLHKLPAFDRVLADLDSF